MKKSLLVLLAMHFSLSVNAVSGKRSTLEGYVTSFDSKEVVVESGSQQIHIPREKYKSKVKVGEKIYVDLETSELDQFKRTDKKKN